VNQPDAESMCERPGCGHPFGRHYLTYYDDVSGCSMISTDNKTCTCAGFAKMDIWKRPIYAKPDSGDRSTDPY
jgi:hypothetical protein